MAPPTVQARLNLRAKLSGAPFGVRQSGEVSSGFG